MVCGPDRVREGIDAAGLNTSTDFMQQFEASLHVIALPDVARKPNQKCLVFDKKMLSKMASTELKTYQNLFISGLRHGLPLGELTALPQQTS